MILTEPREPPADYMPEREFKPWPKLAPRPTLESRDLARALYKGWANDTWALRHWRTGHNCHVEHWYGVSLPGRAK